VREVEAAKGSALAAKGAAAAAAAATTKAMEIGFHA
jgi:hypothetical protein